MQINCPAGRSRYNEFSGSKQCSKHEKDWKIQFSKTLTSLLYYLVMINFQKNYFFIREGPQCEFSLVCGCVISGGLSRELHEAHENFHTTTSRQCQNHPSSIFSRACHKPLEILPSFVRRPVWHSLPSVKEYCNYYKPFAT